MPFSVAARLAPGPAAAVARRRERLGARSTFALRDDSGARLAAGDLPRWLRFARTVRVGIEGNAGVCRGLLETRYGPSPGSNGTMIDGQGRDGERRDSTRHDQRSAMSRLRELSFPHDQV